MRGSALLLLLLASASSSRRWPVAAAGHDCALPLPPGTARPAHEVVATTFTRVDGQVWRNWSGWGAITTVIDVYRFGNESALACLAHRHGAQLLLNMGDKEFLHWGFNRSRDLGNATAFALFASKVAAVGADGISIGECNDAVSCV